MNGVNLLGGFVSIFVVIVGYLNDATSGARIERMLKTSPGMLVPNYQPLRRTFR